MKLTATQIEAVAPAKPEAESPMRQVFKVTSNTTNDLEFERMENGNALLTVHQMFGNNDLYFEINDVIWGSLVLIMTKFGERPNDWHEFMDHHHGRVDILEYAKTERLKKTRVEEARQ